MRILKPGTVMVHAIAGTNVVFFGINMSQEDTADLLGFAIQREDLTENEITWLRSSKTFPSCPSTTPFDNVSSQYYPFQAFQWADYTAKPAHNYKYRIVPMFAPAGNLQSGDPTEVEVATEIAEGDIHSVYFNRGVIASQAYTKKFGSVPPSVAGQPAYDWLTRDLLPGFLNFIARAVNDRFGLYAAIYETRFKPVLDALRAAHLRTAKVALLYDSRPGTGEDNLEFLEEAKIKGLSHGRAKGKIMHNKFIVLTKDDTPIAVWTGSTNLSTNAIFGQLNVGHVVNDETIASAYFEYWKQLKNDPERAEMRIWAGQNNPCPPPEPEQPMVEVFSPHSGTGVFNWFKSIADSAHEALFMTFPFGIVKNFRPVFNKNDGILRFALLEKYVNGGNAVSRALAIQEIEAARRLPNIGMTLGGRIFLDYTDGWLKEPRGIGTFVNWVHTKFMLVDPLSENPITISGSANWSEPSTNQNDENMLIIHGDKRVADIYLTEFMRIFSHHRFRESLSIHLNKYHNLTNWKPRDLDETDGWVRQHYDNNKERYFRRRYFSTDNTD